MPLDIEETIQIHFSSRFANNYVNGSFSNCEFFLPVIEVPPQHQIYVSCISASIPYTFYNIDSNNNYLEYFVYNSVDNGASTLYDLTITPGNYNAYQLQNYLKTQLGSNFTVTYDVITNKFTFSHTYMNFGFRGDTSTALELIGFKKSLFFIESNNKTLTSEYCVNLLSKHCLCVALNYTTGNINYSNKLTNNVLVSIPIKGNPYSMITYENTNAYKANLYKNSLTYIKIKIVDQNNNIVDLNGCHWTMTFQLDIVKFVE